MIVEDVHWVDEATLDLLRYTGRRISGLPVLALVSYRDDQVKPYDPLQIVIGDLATLASTHHLVVPPLSRSAVAALVGPDGLDPDRVYRLTGGNAFFIGEVLAAGDGIVSPTVRDAVRGRVARLSNRGQRAWTHAHPPMLFGEMFMEIPAANRYEIPASYALHAWLWQDNPSGVFAAFNPDVACA